jgi:hypothetical protein
MTKRVGHSEAPAAILPRTADVSAMLAFALTERMTVFIGRYVQRTFGRIHNNQCLLIQSELP